ncbi:MAG: GntR family transcriptional regulator [Aggregatilineales bacterium]
MRDQPRGKTARSQKTKKDVLVEVLRDAILSGELQPGERLLQEELAERFQVSSTPVREAIQQLVAEGVLSHSPYRGVQVAEVDPEGVLEVYLMRSVLERLATERGVPNLTIADIRRLHAIHDEIVALLHGEERGPMVRLNREFHMCIYEAAKLPLLLQTVKTLWIKTPWDTLFVVPNRAQQIVVEHAAVLAAIDQADPELAGKRMQEHLEKGLTALANYLGAQSQ